MTDINETIVLSIKSYYIGTLEGAYIAIIINILKTDIQGLYPSIINKFASLHHIIHDNCGTSGMDFKFYIFIVKTSLIIGHTT
ncbi:MAG: hypothetical protein EBR34_15560 [Sphingomonadaceae bacterium]|nr:hypothetical protein [Sphingomonadaceae bacterium]